ncbi:MAG: hypothetical protein A2Z34_06980 [Planctomycetes bacterium RBG_16_59_8]|nr:MAG: hypothetical protein A2Z34_06980 [Planctomycetes bacterium RBG_16_59_8]
MQEVNDLELMARFQRGDEEAFAELIRRHQQSILNLICRYIGDAAEAEDLAQEAFLKVYRARLSWQPTARFSTWLHRIVVNMCLNEIRDRKRMTVGTPPEEIVAGDEREGVVATELRRELQDAVKRAVASLPEHQRMAVLLVKYEGLSYDDASETMGVSVEAFKSLLFRARESLKQNLREYVEGEEAAP